MELNGKENIALFIISMVAFIFLFMYILDKKPLAEEKSSNIIIPKPGYFITLDKTKTSMYITRMVDAKEKPIICFVQVMSPDGSFHENCVSKDYMDDIMQSLDGRFTKTNEYIKKE